jgi:M6 family metalloprotease-like protein
MSSPFISKTFTFTQPDGSKIELRGWGDQHYAVFETLDGYTVVRNPDSGFFEIAQVSDDGTELEPAGGPQGSLDGMRATVQPGVRIDREAARARGMEGALRMGGRRCDQRREERKNLARAARTLGGPMLAPPQRETVGNFVGLCLLIDFPDEHGTISREEVERFCNQSGYSGFGNNGSVSDYFNDNSLGRCTYTNIVTEYYRAQHPRSHYTNPNIRYGVRARQLIVEALAHFKSAGFDFTPLTADSGGFVYAMNVYYAGKRINNWSEGLWPHASALASSVDLVPGKSAFDYQFTDMGQELTLGTFCHENGHMLCDYPDLYDYGGESSGVGAFCLMCAGASINRKNPTHISAYLKRLSGWAESVMPIQHNQKIDLPAGQNRFAMFAKDSGEYFIIENRKKAGRDVSLPGEGLAIWHVDEGGDNSNEQMTPSKHYELSLEQADADFRLESTPHHLGDANDLFGSIHKAFDDATVPGSKWWDGTASDLELFEISSPSDTVSFKARLFKDEGDSLSISEESTPGLDIPDNHAGGVVDTITVAQNATIAAVQLTVDITHTYRGDLHVILLAPWGETLVLHQQNQGGNVDDLKRDYDETDLQDLAKLHGHSTQGDWQLLVRDLAPADVGTLNRWALKFTASGVSNEKVVLEEAPGMHIPDNDPVGIERSLAATAPGSVGSIEASVDIAHTYISDLRVSLHSPSGTQVVLHDKTGGSSDNLVTTFTGATTPELRNMDGETISGVWRLKVGDHEGQDLGKLNSWRLVINPAP